MEIAPYTNSEAEAAQIARLYHGAIHAISPAFYTPEQLEAWAPTPPDFDFWRDILARRQIWLGWRGDQLAGFIALKDGGYIDCLYTHPAFQKCGVGTLLYHHIESLAIARACKNLSVDASKIAKGFFARKGFVVTRSNKVERNGQMLVNFHMRKQLV